MDDIAERYVRLALSLGVHDERYVDSYYGPPQWRAEAERDALPLAEIRTRASGVVAGLATVAGDEARRAHLTRHARALITWVDILGGATMRFDDESRSLYGAVAPHREPAYFARILEELDDLLPAGDDIASRYDDYVRRFVVPADRLAATVDAAVEECRRRTLPHIDLPAGDHVELTYVTDRPWGAQNVYQGGSRSRIDVNTDSPVHVDRVLDLACHEGYPGHHVFSATMERHLVRGKGWTEFGLLPLFSPIAFTGEGTATLAPEVAYPGGERVAFEREVLCDVAGLDPAGIDRYDRVRRLRRRGVDHATDDVARRHADGELDADATVELLSHYAGMSPDRARRRVRFIEEHRSYVINYTVGTDVARAYLESDPAADRWTTFERMLREPWLVADWIETGDASGSHGAVAP